MPVVAQPTSTDEALTMLHASLDHLTGCVDWKALGAAAQAEALRSLQAAQSKWAVAHAEALFALDACGGYSIEGHPTVQTWLRHSCRMTKKAAADLWKSGACMLKPHWLLRDAMAAGEISESWARQFAKWNDRLPDEEKAKADQILLDAARDGLSLDPDIARIAEAIFEAVMGQRPDPDPGGDGFKDRDVRMGTTLGGAGKLSGDLSAPCAALLAKVFEAFGKPVDRDDIRSQGQRNHDALETALRLGLGVPDVPGSGGMKTRAMVIVTLADLLMMDGASVLVDEWLAAQDVRLRNSWLTAKAGETGWLTGAQAQAAACAAHVTPVVTGTPDWDVIADMADVFLDAHGIGGHGLGPRGPLSPEARLALERTLLAMAVNAVSGPEGLAGFLRARLLARPFNAASLPLDIGDTDQIPDHLRRAVIMRDKHCQWPGGCDRPASQCEPHHLRPRHGGGETSLQNLKAFCHIHHHVYIHRLGWKIIPHPDGTITGISPHGKVIHSHGPCPGQPTAHDPRGQAIDQQGQGPPPSRPG